MKTGSLILIISLLSGCAMTSSKEDLREIFVLMKDRKFNEAEDKFNATQGMTGNYKTYVGNIIPSVNSPNHDDVRSLMDSTKSTFEDCENYLSKMEKLSFVTPDQDGEVTSLNEYQTIKERFENNCTGYASKNYSAISIVKKYTLIDLNADIQNYNNRFQKEVSRLDSELKGIEVTQEKATLENEERKKAYEESPEYYSIKLCEMQSIINAATSIIEKENEAAKVSGYVDKRRMYNAGQAVTSNQKRIQHFSLEYQKKFGKDWDTSACK